MKSRPALWWVLLVAACSVFAASSVFTWYPLTNVRHGPDFRRALIWELLRWNLWLPMAAAVFRGSHRFYERKLGGSIIWNGSIGLVFPVLHTVLLVLFYFPFSPSGTLALLRYRPLVLLPDLLTGIIVCGLVLGLAYARAEAIRAADLEAQLAQAQLEALKMQLHPHFLFNTLNAIAALQMEEPASARQMLVRLSDFLRLTLENSSVQQVRLYREVEFLSCYLEIERARFPRKLTVEIIVDPEAQDAMVPNLILQPIVENAIRHGICTRASPGRVVIRAGRLNGSLFLSVHNTGPGIPVDSRDGRGLAITRSRLGRLYGNTAHFSLQNGAGGGVEARIQIPFERSLCAS